MDRRTLLAGLGALVCAPLGAAPAGAALPVQAGDLGVLAIRVSRLWVQAGADIDRDAALMALTSTARAFEQQFIALSPVASRAGAGALMLGIEQRWRAYRLAWAMRPEPAAARRVLSLGDEVLKQTELTAAKTAPADDRRVSVAVARGRAERMLRIAIARQWGVAAPDASIDLDRERAAFTARLDTLAARTAADPAFSADLQLARQQWGFVEPLLGIVDLATVKRLLPLAQRLTEALESLARRG